MPYFVREIEAPIPYTLHEFNVSGQQCRAFVKDGQLQRYGNAVLFDGRIPEGFNVPINYPQLTLAGMLHGES